MHLKMQKKFERDKSSIVTLDGIERGILPDRILLPLFPIPYEGDIVDSQADELLETISHQARQQLLKYVADSEHSTRQCHDYLSRKLYPKALIDNLITEFQDKKYIDDARYLRILIGSLIDRKKSKRAILTKLRETRLPSVLWETTLNELFKQADNLENLKEQVLKLRLSYAELPLTKQREKIFTSLFRKGFDLEDIHTAWNASKGT